MKYCRTYYQHNHHHNYHHHAYYNHHWSYHHLHLPYPSDTFLQFKHFPNHPNLTPFNLKCQQFLLDTPTAPPNFQTLPASVTYCQVFFSPFKTTSDHMSSTKPTRVITSPTSISSSSKTVQSCHVKFQPPYSIPLTSPCTSTFPSSPIPTAHPSTSYPPPRSRHHLVHHSPSKVLPATPSSSLYIAKYLTEEMQASPPVVTHVAYTLIFLNLLAKTTTKLFLVGILVGIITFFIQI